MVSSAHRPKWNTLTTAGLLVLILMATLSGCAYVPAGAYDAVDRAVEELGLDDAGDVKYQGHLGGVVNAPGPNPTVIMVIEGENTAEVVAESFRDAGFQTSGENGSTTIWIRDRGDGYLGAVVKNLDAGDSASVGSDDTRIQVDGPGVWLQIYSI